MYQIRSIRSNNSISCHYNYILGTFNTHYDAYHPEHPCWYTMEYCVKIIDFGHSRIRLNTNKPQIIHNSRNPFSENFLSGRDVEHLMVGFKLKNSVFEEEKALRKNNRIRDNSNSSDSSNSNNDSDSEEESDRIEEEIEREKTAHQDLRRKMSKGMRPKELIRHPFFQSLINKPTFTNNSKNDINTNSSNSNTSNQLQPPSASQLVIVSPISSKKKDKRVIGQHDNISTTTTKTKESLPNNEENKEEDSLIEQLNTLTINNENTNKDKNSSTSNDSPPTTTVHNTKKKNTDRVNTTPLRSSLRLSARRQKQRGS